MYFSNFVMASGSTKEWEKYKKHMDVILCLVQLVGINSHLVGINLWNSYSQAANHRIPERLRLEGITGGDLVPPS